MEERLDLALFWLASMAKQQVLVNKLEERVSALETKVASQDATINNLLRENKASKEMANNRDQEARGRILKPILTAARRKGDIPMVPYAANLIDECYRSDRQTVGPSASDPPPPHHHQAVQDPPDGHPQHQASHHSLTI
jgi:uncharacterized coiled-coil protein SlyX